MAVTSLPKHYQHILSHDSIGDFFDKLFFTHTKNEKKKKNGDNVDTIVFPHCKVEDTDCNPICNKNVV